MKPLKNIELNVMKDCELVSEKDLVMAIIGLQHLNNVNSCYLGVDALIAGASTVAGIVTDTMIFNVVFAAFSVTFATKLVIDIVDRIKANKFKNILVEELISRFETPQMAYLEIAELVTSVTREEIIEYLNSIGCEVINVE